MSNSRVFNRIPILLITPLVTVITVFLAYPILRTVLMSIQYWYLPGKGSETVFVGLENFFKLVQDSAFFDSLWTTGRYLAITVAARFALGLGTALLLNESFKGRGAARAMIIIPWAVPEVVATLIWVLMYDQVFGVVNFGLSALGLIRENLRFLEDPSLALPAAMVVNVWKGFPFVAVMLLAGLQSIPKELYEAARVDGADRLQRLGSITLPMLKPVSKVVFLLLVIWTMKDFAIVYLLAGGGPSRATELLTIYVYKTAFRYFDFGLAAAGGMVLLLFSLVFTVFYMRGMNQQNQ